MSWIALALGLLLLTAGGEALVRGASRLARMLGISPLVVGLTVVSMGTSAPELVVSLLAGLEGRNDIAVGNVVGGNVFNVLLILGMCAVARPLVVASQLVVRDIPIMIAVSLALWLFASDGRLGLGEGAVLLAGLVAFSVDSVRASRKENVAVADEYEASLEQRESAGPRVPTWVLLPAGLALLVAGARLLVDAAVEIARALGLDEAVIGLTVVAAGTSLPEVATSLVATLRGERDIAVGNVVGSNLFNILGVLGVSALFAGGDLRVSPSIENFDIPVMAAAAFACLPFVLRDRRLSRWEGAIFLGYYVAYSAYLILAAKQHAALEPFGAAMLEFTLPLTALVMIRSLLLPPDARSSDSP